jgi:hypothetical protein
MALCTRRTGEGGGWGAEGDGRTTGGQCRDSAATTYASFASALTSQWTIQTQLRPHFAFLIENGKSELSREYMELGGVWQAAAALHVGGSVFCSA